MNKREAILKGASLIEQALEEKDAVYIWAAMDGVIGGKFIQDPADSAYYSETYDVPEHMEPYWRTITSTNYCLEDSYEQAKQQATKNVEEGHSPSCLPDWEYFAERDPRPLVFRKTKVASIDKRGIYSEVTEEGEGGSQWCDVLLDCLDYVLTPAQERELIACKRALLESGEDCTDLLAQEKLVELWPIRVETYHDIWLENRKKKAVEA
jgi:hypothetical protein